MTKFEVAFTGEKVTEESAAIGDAEERGWVDLHWNRKQFHENKEDVRTFEFDSLAEAEEFIESEIGSYDSYDGGTWYAADPDIDYVTGASYSYAAHVTEVQ
jgi:hypothetical protein